MKQNTLRSAVISAGPLPQAMAETVTTRTSTNAVVVRFACGCAHTRQPTAVAVNSAAHE